jgi:riboflavin kinase/FMN adenylyltransferase
VQIVRAARPEDFVWDIPRPVVALGTMDGVHLGHQAVLARARELAQALGGTPGALTFAQHPLEVVRPLEAPPVLTPLPLKLRLLERCGAAAAVAIEFSPAVASITAEAFVAEILFARLGAVGLAVGHDFGFGRGRRGTVELLRGMAEAAGVSLAVVPPVRLGAQVVSSRHIRALLGAGQVVEARAFLGRPFCILGEVEPGAGRGGGLGYATANLAIRGRPVLQDGVYAGRVLLRGVFHDAMMNLGVAPTFGDAPRRLEIHLAGWEGPLYGERLLVYVLERLRDERRFPDASALAAQLARDRGAAEAVWQAARDLPWSEWTLQV